MDKHGPIKPGEALLAFDTRRPITAAEVASLLSAMSSDYEKLKPGRSLVVTRLETGSLFVFIQDALATAEPVVRQSKEYFEAISASVKFFGVVREAMNASKKNPQKIRSRSPGYRAVREIVKIAAESGSAVELEYESEANEKLRIKLTAPEVKTLGSVAEAPRQLSSSGPGLLASPPMKSLPQFDGAALVAAVGDGPLSSEARQIIAAMVLTLYRMGLSSSIEDIAVELRHQGREEIADAVIAEKRRLESGGSVNRLIAGS